MKRYFYSGNLLTKAWLDSQFNAIRFQDQIYRDALLAALKIQPHKISQFKALRQQILDLTIAQQTQYATNFHMEELFKHFDALHRNTRGRRMIVRGKESLVKDLVDPDKFPIWDLKRKANTFYSIWNTVMGGVRYDLGHQLVVRDSLVEHPEGGRGLFLELSHCKKEIQVGDFLGLVPGAVYDSYKSYENVRLKQAKSFEKVPEHLHFPSGKVLELGEFKQHDELTNTQISLQPCMVNPYALGQFVNHPPFGRKPNVIFTEILCKSNFFPPFLRKYLPYNSFLPTYTNPKEQVVPLFGIFAIQPIKNREQLYVDYCENHIYPIEGVPEWMVEPDYGEDGTFVEGDPYKLNFSKEQYEHPSPAYWELIEKQALKRNQQAYDTYLKTIRHRPKKVLYQDSEVKISGMGGQPPHPRP